MQVDNAIVATPDFEATIFADEFDPEMDGISAVEPSDKVATKWGEIKNQ